MHIITNSKVARAQYENGERKEHEAKKHQEWRNRVDGTNNPYVGGTDFETPVTKKEFLGMLEETEATAKDPKLKKAAQQEYMHAKRYASDDGLK